MTRCIDCGGRYFRLLETRLHEADNASSSPALVYKRRCKRCKAIRLDGRHIRLLAPLAEPMGHWLAARPVLPGPPLPGATARLRGWLNALLDAALFEYGPTPAETSISLDAIFRPADGGNAPEQSQEETQEETHDDHA